MTRPAAAPASQGGFGWGTAAGNRSRYTPLAARSRQSHVRSLLPGIAAPLPPAPRLADLPPPISHRPHVSCTFVFSQIGISVLALVIPAPACHVRPTGDKLWARVAVVRGLVLDGGSAVPDESSCSNESFKSRSWG